MGDLSQVAIAQHQAMELVKVTLLRALSGDAE
jgi:hypothetical protein